MPTVMHTCRFCKESEFGWRAHAMLKYGARHHAHWACYLKAGKGIESLKLWQLESAPFGPLKDLGLYEKVCARIGELRAVAHRGSPDRIAGNAPIDLKTAGKP
jgi:hypothetical protein